MAITFDAASHTRDIDQSVTTTIAHTCSGSDRYLFVVVGDSAGSAPDPSGVTYNGVAMTALFNKLQTGAFRVTGWGLIAPATGTHDIVVTFPGAIGPDEVALGGTSWNGVHQTVPTGTAATAGGAASPATVNVTSATGELVVDGAYVFGTTITEGAGQTNRWEEENIGGGTSGASSSEAGAASVTMSWTFSPSDTWAIGGIPLKPSGAAAAPPDGSNDYYAVPPVKQAGINTAQPHLLTYDGFPPRGLVPSPVVPYGKTDYYDARLFSQTLRGAKPQWQQHDAYAMRFVQQIPPPGSGGFSWYYDTRPFRGWRRPRPELLVYDAQATKSFVFTVTPQGAAAYYDIEKYPALQFRHPHEGWPARGNVPTAATPQGWTVYFDTDQPPKAKPHLIFDFDHMTDIPPRAVPQGWTVYFDVDAPTRSKIHLLPIDVDQTPDLPPQPATQGWTAYFDAEVVRPRARDYLDAPTPAAQAAAAVFIWTDYYDLTRLRPVLTQQHETYPPRGNVPTAATAQGWWRPLDSAVIRPVSSSRQQFDGYQHFIPPVAVNLGPLGWSMFWDKGRRPLAPDRMPFLFEQLWQFPTATTPQGWTHLLDTARVRAFPVRLQQYDALGRLSFPTPFVGVTFERFDARAIRPRPFPYSVVDQQPTVVVPPSAYVLFPELFKRPRPHPYITWPEQRVAVLNTPAGTGGPTYFYDRRLVVMHRPLAEVVPFDGRGLPFVVVNLIVHRPGKGGLLTPQVLVATKYQPTLGGIKVTPSLGGEVED